MKKITLLLTFIFFTNLAVNSQDKGNKGERNEKIKALKIAFLTEKLKLTTTEAQKFWPVYNKYDAKIYQLERLEKHKLVSKIRKEGGIEAISEEEAKVAFLKIKEIDSKVYSIKMEFDKKLSEIITYKKILTLKTSEKDFIRNLMKKYRKKKENKN